MVGAGLVLGTVLRTPRAEAAYPDRLIKFLVPQPPAGPTDIIARIFSHELGEALKTTTIVENKSGAGGNVPIGAFSGADPSGYNLMVVSSVLVVNPAIFVSVPYDPINDFAPICEIGEAPNSIVVDAKLNIKTMADLLAAARKEPGKINYTSPGIGSNPFMAAEILKLHERVDMVHIPYVGGGPALQATLAGTAQVLFGSIAPVRPYIRSGQLRPIAILGSKRWHELPDVPTWNELGYQGQSFETFQSLLAPARTPPDILKHLEATSLAVLARPEVQAKLLAAGFVTTARNSTALKARIAKEVPMWKEMAQLAGIKPR